MGYSGRYGIEPCSQNLQICNRYANSCKHVIMEVKCGRVGESVEKKSVCQSTCRTVFIRGFNINRQTHSLTLITHTHTYTHTHTKKQDNVV